MVFECMSTRSEGLFLSIEGASIASVDETSLSATTTRCSVYQMSKPLMVCRCRFIAIAYICSVDKRRRLRKVLSRMISRGVRSSPHVQTRRRSNHKFG